MISSLLSSFISFVLVLISIAFYTLLERKFLGYSQIRKGPNKISLLGILQPIADAVKLFSKEIIKPTMANFAPFFLAPATRLILALIIWILIPSDRIILFFPFSIVLFLCFSSLSVYTTLRAGWTSNSKYALIGSIRSVAQTISYEVRISLTLLFILLFTPTLNFLTIYTFSSTNISLMAPIVAAIWFVTILAETNRRPFDFAEGESELVSGFNTEYRRNTFTCIFMAEYVNILFISFITRILIIQSLNINLSWLWLSFKISIFAVLFLRVRTSYPRIRYDWLIALTWTSFLPISLSAIILGIFILFLYYSDLENHTPNSTFYRILI